MPWFPELFSASVLERICRDAADARAAEPVPYFDGVRSGEIDALVGSFAGEPELHHPVRGRVKGRRAFERFVPEINAWLSERNAVFSPVERVLTPQSAIEETVMTLDGDTGRVEVPVAVAADRNDDGRIIELRISSSMWPLTGEHHHRAPLLEPDPRRLRPRARRQCVHPPWTRPAARAVSAILLQRRRDPARALRPHRRLAPYKLEYNILRWGRTELPPEAGIAVYLRGATGIAVYLRGATGRLVSARIYDDLEPPLGDMP